MYNNKKICIVVPAHNVGHLVDKVIDTVPKWVDLVIVVNDASKDNTVSVAQNTKNFKDGKVYIINHEKNQGVGGAIISGYKEALKREIDISVVMAGDAQMDPDDLESIVKPVAEGEVDYTKGNRIFRGEAWGLIPHKRYLGNAVLSLMTKIASGYWHIADSQCGYTAISLNALKTLKLDWIFKRYGMPNDILIRLNIENMKVRDISVRPVYNVGEISGLKIRKVMFVIPWILFKGFGKRMLHKYVIRDFHPLLFFYFFGISFILAGTVLSLRVMLFLFFVHFAPRFNSLLAMFLLMVGIQLILFAMWFDMEYNKGLR